MAPGEQAEPCQTQKGRSLPVQLMELGHGAKGPGGISGCPAEKENTVVKGLVWGIMKKRAGLSSVCASLYHLGHGSNPGHSGDTSRTVGVP